MMINNWNVFASIAKIFRWGGFGGALPFTIVQHHSKSSFSRRGVNRPLHQAVFLPRTKIRRAWSQQNGEELRSRSSEKMIQNISNPLLILKQFRKISLAKKIATETFFSKREKHMLILVSSIMYFFLSARPGRRPVYLCFLKRSRHSMRETTAGNYNI
jgi:hypothetical protein